MHGCSPATEGCSPPTCGQRSGGSTTPRVVPVTDLVKSSAERHARFGHAGHLLEPNIRDSAVRDIHTLGWASKVFGRRGTRRRACLLRPPQPHRADLIEEAQSFLLRLRIELHLATDRHQDQLYLAESDDIAVRLGYEATMQRPAADRLMQELRSARTSGGRCGRASGTLASHQLRSAAGTRRRARMLEMVVRSSARTGWRSSCTTNVADDPAGWLRVFRRSILRDAHISRASLNRLHERVDAAQTVTVAGGVFHRYISWCRMVRALEAMDLWDSIVALFPEWRRSGRTPSAISTAVHRRPAPLAAVAELAMSRSLDDRDLRDAWSLVGDPDALFFATFLHDVGRARRGPFESARIAVATPLERRVAGRLNTARRLCPVLRDRRAGDTA